MAKNKSEKKVIGFAVLAVIIIGIIISISFLAVPQKAFSGAYPGYAYSTVTSSLSCVEESEFDKQFLPYKTQVNMRIVTNIQEADALSDNGVYADWRISDSNGKSPRGTRTSNKLMSFEEARMGVMPQVKCDGTFDCNYGFTNEKWELIGDKCFVEEPDIVVYRLQDNECVFFTIPESSKLDTDFEVLSTCISNIGVEEDTTVIEDIIDIIIVEEEEFLQCIDNVGCIDLCGDQIPTCTENTCSCDGIKKVISPPTKFNFLILIPIILVILIILIIVGIVRRNKK